MKGFCFYPPFLQDLLSGHIKIAGGVEVLSYYRGDDSRQQWIFYSGIGEGIRFYEKNTFIPMLV